jgi:hypothetical protein
MNKPTHGRKQLRVGCDPGSVRKPALTRGVTLFRLNLVAWMLFCAFLLAPGAYILNKATANGQMQRHPPQRAFIFFYTMGRILNEYPSERLYDYELQQELANQVHVPKNLKYGPVTYPPYVGILFRPFARLPFAKAYLLWLTTSLTLYLFGLRVLTRHFFSEDSIRQSLSFCFALSFLPFVWIMIGGQIPTLGFLGLALAFREEDRGNPFMSGLAMSLCLYKPTFMVLLIPMLLVSRRKQTLLGLMAGGAALVVFATAVEGIGVWAGYVRLLLSFGSAAVRSHDFQDLPNYMDLSSFSSMLPGGRSLPGGSILAALACLILYFLFSAWRKCPGPGTRTSTLVWATTVTWTLVLNLYVPIYDSILGIIAVIATVAVLNGGKHPRLRRQFGLAWTVTLLGSWVTIGVARSTGFQMFTVMFSLLGTLQLIAIREVCKVPELTDPQPHAALSTESVES